MNELKTVDEMMELVESVFHKFIEEIQNVENPLFDEDWTSEIRVELEKWQAEIGRLNAIIKANVALDFCLQITNRNRVLSAENKELQDKLTNSMWDAENERTNRELVEDECDKLKDEKGE
jgi:hypothetical protein